MPETIEFTTVTKEEWEQIPAPVPVKPTSRFEQVLASVSEGNIARIDVKEEKDIKGIRIAIARKARNLGFITEFRNLGNALYVKRSEKPLEEKPRKSKTEIQEEKASSKKKTGMS